MLFYMLTLTLLQHYSLDLFLPLRQVNNLTWNFHCFVMLQVPVVCPFQTPATYTIGIFDENGDEVGLTAPKPAIAANASNSVVDVFETKLVTGNSYSAELTIQHPNVPGEAFITFIGIG